MKAMCVYTQHTVQLLEDFHHWFWNRDIDVFPVHSEMVRWFILHTGNLNRDKFAGFSLV